ncbi:hypothetical protein PMG11_07165 [Penicillium brasilianum]|uniref:Uncharacterized protein n=1 Tax=Penicillium brasilianum TaxID=104259 RepID=A0A0F7TRU4_PENBI|nr:hypothetical protein PMG11_07165 [Penicillium brasilianum]
MDAGFSRFLQEHSSPTHQRVTAGGRIVPMLPEQQVPAGGRVVPPVTPPKRPRPAQRPGKAKVPGRVVEVEIIDYSGAHSAHDALADVIANAPNAPEHTPAPAGLLPAFERAPAAALAPAAPSLNPKAPVFVPHGPRIPTTNVARMNSAHIQNGAGNAIRNFNESIGAAAPVPEKWAHIWPPFARSNRKEGELQAFVQVRMHLAAQFTVSPVHVYDLPPGFILRGNPALSFQPHQPLPLVFHGAWIFRPQVIGPLGMYWTFLTEIFRVTNEGHFQAQKDYGTNLGHLIRFVKRPLDQYEAFILIHATEWLKYHCRLFDDLIASVDYRRAPLPGPDPGLTAERVFYVNKRAYATEAIKELEQALAFVHLHMDSPFWRELICLTLNGRVLEDAHHSPTRDGKSDVSSEDDDRHEGAEDVFSGDEEASVYAEHLEFAHPHDSLAPGGGPVGAIGQADESVVGHTESGSLVDIGSSESSLTERQPARGQDEDGLEGGGGGGESSSQSAGVEVGPSKGKQIVNLGHLR